MLARALFLTILTIPSPVLHAQVPSGDWSQFRGDRGLGHSPSTTLPIAWSDSKNIVWKREIQPGTSSPVIHDSRIYITSYSGYNVPGKPRGDQEQLRLHLHCLNRNDGQTIWTREIRPKLPEQPSTRDDHGYASSTPAVDRERVYVFFGKSGVFAFSHAGEQLWTADVGTNLNPWGSANSPVLHEDLVIINASVESESLVALNRTTGKEVWRTRGIRESWNTPIVNTLIDGRKEIVLAIHGKVLGIEPTSGKILWTCNTEIPWYMVPGLVASEGIVYCIGGRNGGGALAIRGGGSGDVTNSHRLWTLKKGSNVSSPIFHKGYLYWMNDVNETAYCVNARTGAIEYQEPLNRFGQVYASPVIADGKIYYLSRLGRVAVIAAKPSFEQLQINTLDDRSAFNASPAVGGDNLFLRSDRFLYCIGVQ